MKRFKLTTFTFLLAISFAKFANARDSVDAIKAQSKKTEQLSDKEKLNIAAAKQTQFYADYQKEFESAHAAIEAKQGKKEVKEDSVDLEQKWNDLIQRQRAFYIKLVEFLTPRKQKYSATECDPLSGPSRGYGEMKLTQGLYESFTPEEIASLKKELGACLVLPESATTAGLASDTNSALASVDAARAKGSR